MNPTLNLSTATGQEIEAAVAEHVAGWTRFGMYSHIASGKQLLGCHDVLHGTPPEDRDKPEDDQRYLPVPNYLTDSNAVLALLEKYSGSCVDVSFDREEREWTVNLAGHCPMEFSTSFCRAACICLLKASGKVNLEGQA